MLGSVRKCCLAEIKHKASLVVNICLQACVIVHKIDLNEGKSHRG